MTSSIIFYGIELPESEWKLNFVKDKIAEEKHTNDNYFTNKYTTTQYLEETLKKAKQKANTFYIERYDNYKKYMGKIEHTINEYNCNKNFDIQDFITGYNEIRKLHDFQYGIEDIVEDYITKTSPKNEYNCNYFRINYDRSSNKQLHYIYGIELVNMFGDKMIEFDIKSIERIKDKVSKMIVDKFGIQPKYYLNNTNYFD